MTLKTKLKLFFLCFFLLLGAIILFLTILPYLVSTDAIRLRLARDLSSMTGYNVQLREPPKISFLPSFRASLPHVVLTDNSQDGAPLMNAEEIIVDMSLFDALRGHARFSQTEIIRPHFIIEKPTSISAIVPSIAQSAGSFGSAIRATQTRLNGNNPLPKSELKKTSLRNQPFGHIIIREGRLSYPARIGDTDNESSAREPRFDDIRNINAEINWPQNSGMASIVATGFWHGIANNLNIDANNALLLLSGGESYVRASLNSVKGGITYTGNIQFGKQFKADGHVSARSPGVNQTLNWLKLRPPFGANITTPFTWQSNLKTDGQRAELKNIILTIGEDRSGDKGRGALEVNLQKAVPYITGSLAFEKLNIGLLAPNLFTADSAPVATSQYNIDMPIFNLFGLDLRVSSREINFNGIPVKNSAASIQVQENGLIFDVGTMDIFGGQAQSSLHLNSHDDRITGLIMRFSTSNTDLTKLKQEIGENILTLPPFSNLQGRASIDLNLQASLPDQLSSQTPIPAPKPEIIGHDTANNPLFAKDTVLTDQISSYTDLFLENVWPYATGKLIINMKKGQIEGFDMAQFQSLVRANKSFNLPRKERVNKKENFSFDSFKGNFTLNKKVIAPLSAQFKFNQHELALTGRANIAQNELQFEGQFDPLRLNEAGQCMDVECLQKSLLPQLSFQANGKIVSQKNENTSHQDQTKNIPVQTLFEISPSVGFLP